MPHRQGEAVASKPAQFAAQLLENVAPHVGHHSSVAGAFRQPAFFQIGTAAERQRLLPAALLQLPAALPDHFGAHLRVSQPLLFSLQQLFQTSPDGCIGCLNQGSRRSCCRCADQQAQAAPCSAALHQDVPEHLPALRFQVSCAKATPDPFEPLSIRKLLEHPWIATEQLWLQGRLQQFELGADPSVVPLRGTQQGDAALRDGPQRIQSPEQGAHPHEQHPVVSLPWHRTPQLIPQAVQSAASAVGIDRGADLINYLFVLLFLITALYFYARMERLQSQVATLVREQVLRQAERGEESSSEPDATAK